MEIEKRKKLFKLKKSPKFGAKKNNVEGVLERRIAK